jgi:hypothetical protein
MFLKMFLKNQKYNNDIWLYNFKNNIVIVSIKFFYFFIFLFFYFFIFFYNL